MRHLEQTEVDKLLSKLPTPEVLSGVKISNVEFEKVITFFFDTSCATRIEHINILRQLFFYCFL